MGYTMKGARVNAGLTQKDVAKAMNVTSVTISSWERGINSPSLFQASRLAEMYGITLNDFILPAKQI